MEQNMTEQLVKFLQEKKVDFVTLSKLPASLKKQLGLISGAKAADVVKSLTPHLSGRLEIRKKSNSTYLLLKQPLDDVLLRVLSPRGGETVGKLKMKVPFKPDEVGEALNQLVDKGSIKIKLNKSLLPCVYPAEGEGNVKKDTVTDPSVDPRVIVGEEPFRVAFRKLAGGKSYVRICDMRRCLNWSAQDFDAMLKKLRNAGQLQLQEGDTDFFTKQDIDESFVDENGFRMLTMKWRQ